MIGVCCRFHGTCQAYVVVVIVAVAAFIVVVVGGGVIVAATVVVVAVVICSRTLALMYDGYWLLMSLLPCCHSLAIF